MPSYPVDRVRGTWLPRPATQPRKNAGNCRRNLRKVSYYHDDAESAKVKQVDFSVKSGHLKNDYVRELPGILACEQAQIGVLITLEPPTQPMRTEAASAGSDASPWGTKHPRVQILTVGEILDAKLVDLPPSRDNRIFKKAPRAEKNKANYCQMSLISPLDDHAMPDQGPDALRIEIEQAGIAVEPGG